VKECLGRTINTTWTTLITIVALYVLGVDSIKEFACPSSSAFCPVCTAPT
jgi:preprotein translocase subunit SecF